MRLLEEIVLDVTDDIRLGNRIISERVAVELLVKNQRQLRIPKGFAHGFVVLSEAATFANKVDTYYSPESNRVSSFNGPSLEINWKAPLMELILSLNDVKRPHFMNTYCFKKLDYEG